MPSSSESFFPTGMCSTQTMPGPSLSHSATSSTMNVSTHRATGLGLKMSLMARHCTQMGLGFSACAHSFQTCNSVSRPRRLLFRVPLTYLPHSLRASIQFRGAGGSHSDQNPRANWRPMRQSSVASMMGSPFGSSQEFRRSINIRAGSAGIFGVSFRMRNDTPSSSAPDAITPGVSVRRRAYPCRAFSPSLQNFSNAPGAIRVWSGTPSSNASAQSDNSCHF